MKKKVVIILMALCILTGCGSQTQSNNTENPTKKNTESKAETTKQVKNEQETKVTETEQTQKPIIGNAAGVANWHDTADQIKKKETNSFDSEQDGVIVYETTLNGNDAYLRYYTDTDYGCYSVSYLCYNLPYDYQYCKSTYDDMVSILTRKYGEPNSNERKVLSSMAEYSNDDTNLLMGYIEYIAMWEVEDKNIAVWVYYNPSNCGMRLQVGYYAPDYDGEGYVNPDTNGL